MDTGRKTRVKKSVLTTLALQITTLACGLIVPRVLLGAYGSEAYGATTSIAQFLSYITFLEGGIGGVARAALYKPLAENDKSRISVIVYELKRFFRIIAFISLGYALILACTFKNLSHIECYDWMTTFWLVLAIAISTFGQYFIGISYSALIQADQRIYLINALSIVTTVMNAILVVFMVQLGSDLVSVKLISSCVFLLKPTAMWLYVKRKYGLNSHPEPDRNALNQKWTGLGQHIAFYIHSNTDITILTVLDNLESVSVYSVYHMVTANIQNIVTAVCSGMASLFGDMYAREETQNLKDTFHFYETIISLACTILFSTVYVMIVQFIGIYTRGITDADYIQPLFGCLLTLAAELYCLRMPYDTLVTSAGHFKQTRMGSYGEAVINLAVSLILVWRLGLIGVAIGTIAAIGYRTLYYVFYLSRNIILIPITGFFQRQAVNAAITLTVCFLCRAIMPASMEGYLSWAYWAVVAVAISAAVSLLFNLIFYKNETIRIMHIINRVNPMKKRNL